MENQETIKAPDIVDQAISIVRSGARLTDIAVVEVSDGEVVKYLTALAPDIVDQARKDITIAKQAGVIHNLSAPADTESEDAEE